jgi:DNA-binding transcriptional ArsR family regulator
MPVKKVRIEIFNNGDRYTITFEGQVTREKTLRLLDLVELLGGIPTITPESERSPSELLKIDKVCLVAKKKFPIGWFSSRDIQTSYEEQYNEPIRLSTVSTYLSRLADRGLLTKNGTVNQKRYRITTPLSDYQIHKKGRYTHANNL